MVDDHGRIAIFGKFGRHDDREEPLHDGLADFLNVASQLGQRRGHGGEDPDSVGRHQSDDVALGHANLPPCARGRLPQS